ncbi:hypothetical protein L202_05152 [Cryptococcus amylolentus CBS 6039]|uniref:Uncharacterized protein n=1 Tax=Cryptococcus amylolentus CBS 6039 TaxID=1295533 RepID=A0A1E3HL97_9TREE|nr:hypothetical protein L202_05152 [Cryptococcus amylolentus CBS 6039]ODN76486.1 hypothetical protein L202_05152 [Cryptococcus amylolentus CBS 6039]
MATPQQPHQAGPSSAQSAAHGPFTAPLPPANFPTFVIDFITGPASRTRPSSFGRLLTSFGFFWREWHSRSWTAGLNGTGTRSLGEEEAGVLTEEQREEEAGVLTEEQSEEDVRAAYARLSARSIRLSVDFKDRLFSSATHSATHSTQLANFCFITVNMVRQAEADRSQVEDRMVVM